MLGNGVVWYDVKGVTEAIRLLRAVEKQLRRGIAKQRAAPADAVLGALETIIGPGFSCVMSAKDGYVMLLSPPVEQDKLRRILIICLDVGSEENNKRIDDKQISRQHRPKKIKKKAKRGLREPIKRNRRVIDQ